MRRKITQVCSKRACSGASMRTDVALAVVPLRLPPRIPWWHVSPLATHTLRCVSRGRDRGECTAMRMRVQALQPELAPPAAP